MVRSIIIVGALAAILAACTQQDAANLQNAAAITCNGATIATAAAVAITADVGASAQKQKDAATAYKVTTDACAALSKLPTVVATAPAAAQAQAIYRKWRHDMPRRVLNSRKFQTFIERAR